MKHTWALQDAKNRFSAVVNRTLKEGPQIVTRHGVPVVAIVPIADFKAQNSTGKSFVQFFRSSPLCGADIDLSRDKSTGRDTQL